jgi:hypothetical protein
LQEVEEVKTPRKRTTTSDTTADRPTGRKRATRKSADVGAVGGVGADGQSADLASSMPQSDEEIRVRAYEIFLERGAEPGRELEDWLQAERECGQQRRTSEREERAAPPVT